MNQNYNWGSYPVQTEREFLRSRAINIFAVEGRLHTHEKHIDFKEQNGEFRFEFVFLLLF